VQGSGYADLLHGDAPVYRHVTPAFDPGKHEQTFKTFHHLYGFHGEGTLTKGPGGLYTHHRGLFLGWAKAKVGSHLMDSWHGTNGSSSRHVKYLPEREVAGPDSARRASVTEWTEKDGTVIVRDTREVAARFPAEGRLVLDWRITIASATSDTVFLDGDPQHAGFQFRADTTIKTFTYLGPADKTGTGDVWNMKDANSWAVNMFSLKDHGYAVMQMDHPKNPRPVVVSHRDYGRFGHYFTAKVPPNKPLTLYFRTLVLDTDRHGVPTQAQAQALYDAYAKADPTVALRPAAPRRHGRAGRASLRLSASPGTLDLLPASLRAYGIEGRRTVPSGPRAAGAAVLRP
jgi:hypothetical protein